MSDPKNDKKISKFLSLVLRHKPEEIGLTLDDNDKQRFAFSEDGKHIRANQGHSIEVDLALTVATPPPLLYHGTASRFLDSIMKEGLKPMDRHDVHLSELFATALAVGTRHGKPVVLEVNALCMHNAGIEFRRSANGVWLTAIVEPKYLTFAGHA